MIAAALLVLFAWSFASVAGATPPHVVTATDTDSCALCHRTHTAASMVGFSSVGNETTGNALIVGAFPKSSGDTQLCFSCHDGLGSTLDIQTPFLSGSGHKIAPATSSFGPKSKQCSDCHDSHGSDHQADGSDFPALLRSRDASGDAVHSGDAYCATCHAGTPSDTWDGLGIWQQTKHANITAPTGTKIVCVACHDAHGSPIAPTVRTRLEPPSAPATVDVAANDRTLCLGCHGGSYATWSSPTTYAASSHGSSVTTVTATGDWAASGVARRVGECQTCHAPMGSADAAGDLVPKLAEKAGPALCDDCHRAGGAATTDIASLEHKPSGPIDEIVAAYGSTPERAGWGSLDVFTRETTSSQILVGPRRFMSGATVDVASGDLDGDGAVELVVAHSGTPTVTVLGASAVHGLAGDPGNYALLQPADLLAVGDVLDDVAGAPELIAAARGTSVVRAYRLNALGLELVSAADAGGPIDGLAVGDVTGGGRADVVLTLAGDPAALDVMHGGGANLTTAAPVPVGGGATNPSLSDFDEDGRLEVVLANQLSASPNISVVRADGSEVATAGASAEASATGAVLTDLLPGLVGQELVAGYVAPDGTSSFAVFPRSGSGFGAAIETSLPVGATPSDMAIGDTDGDGLQEVVVGLAGSLSATGVGAGPGIAIVHAGPDGVSVAAPQLRFGGGAEAAGSASVLVADLGDVGPSRHPVEAASASHVSTETPVVATHVDCNDCHNVHAATSATSTAPFVPGAMAGAWGVSAENLSETQVQLTEKRGVDYEYEVCLKCHSSWSQLGQGRSIASEIDTRAASFHPVEGPAPETHATDTLVAGREPGSLVFCTDCHGNSDAQASGLPAGPHRSGASPLLVSPYTGRPAASDGLLCFGCHKQGVYAPSTEAPAIDGVSGVRSGFYDGATNRGLHALHAEKGFSCDGCHVSHGSTDLPSLLRGDVAWHTESAGNGGGSCAAACHAGSARRAYERP